MANYTIELRKILSSRDIFKSINYDFYEEAYKPIFEEKFIKRFYFREIGVETIERFLINLETTLNEIMPYYKHLYQTTTYKYDPILNYDVTETITREIIGASESDNNSVRVLKYTIDDKIKSKVLNFTKRYGNKYNNFDTIDLKSYKGYIKIIEPNIDSKIDNIHINKIREILERGVYCE